MPSFATTGWFSSPGPASFGKPSRSPRWRVWSRSSSRRAPASSEGRSGTSAFGAPSESARWPCTRGKEQLSRAGRSAAQRRGRDSHPRDVGADSLAAGAAPELHHRLPLRDRLPEARKGEAGPPQLRPCPGPDARVEPLLPDPGIQPDPPFRLSDERRPRDGPESRHDDHRSLPGSRLAHGVPARWSDPSRHGREPDRHSRVDRQGDRRGPGRERVPPSSCCSCSPF